MFTANLKLTVHTTTLPQNLDYFKATEGSEVWERYLDYLDEIVVDGLFNCIQCSLRYLMENTDKTVTGMTPLLEVKLELQVRIFILRVLNVSFVPFVGSRDGVHAFP